MHPRESEWVIEEGTLLRIQQRSAFPAMDLDDNECLMLLHPGDVVFVKVTKGETYHSWTAPSGIGLCDIYTYSKPIVTLYQNKKILLTQLFLAKCEIISVITAENP